MCNLFYFKMPQKLLGGRAPPGAAGEIYRHTVLSDLAARTMGLVMCRQEMKGKGTGREEIGKKGK